MAALPPAVPLARCSSALPIALPWIMRGALRCPEVGDDSGKVVIHLRCFQAVGFDGSPWTSMIAALNVWAHIGARLNVWAHIGARSRLFAPMG